MNGIVTEFNITVTPIVSGYARFTASSTIAVDCDGGATITSYTNNVIKI